MSMKVDNSDEISSLVEINKTARLASARSGLYAVAIFMLLFLAQLRFLPKRSLMNKKDDVPEASLKEA